jgi:hypothetical protein
LKLAGADPALTSEMAEILRTVETRMGKELIRDFLKKDPL